MTIQRRSSSVWLCTWKSWPGIEYPADDVGALAFEQDFLFAGRPVDLHQGRFVLLDARDHVEMLARGVERPDSRGPAGIEGNITPMRDLLAIEAPKPGAVRGKAAGMTRLQPPIEPDELELLPIFPDQRALTGREIKQKNIMPARVTVIEVYRDLVRGNVRPIGR